MNALKLDAPEGIVGCTVVGFVCGNVLVNDKLGVSTIVATGIRLVFVASVMGSFLLYAGWVVMPRICDAILFVSNASDQHQ